MSNSYWQDHFYELELKYLKLDEEIARRALQLLEEINIGKSRKIMRVS